MAKWDGKRDLNNNDDEVPMPKKSCQQFKDSYSRHMKLYLNKTMFVQA
jgi:hypothetical protein